MRFDRVGVCDPANCNVYLLQRKRDIFRIVQYVVHVVDYASIKTSFGVVGSQGSEELALCYYKNINDPEVRGWVYLKDVTEIAEHQDTIILTTVARTLHLYAETRAQHNQWVTGLAKLCPDAFAMIGRESDL